MKKLKLFAIGFAIIILIGMVFGIPRMLCMLGAASAWLQPAWICHKQGETVGRNCFVGMFIFTCLVGFWIIGLFS